MNPYLLKRLAPLALAVSLPLAAPVAANAQSLQDQANFRLSFDTLLHNLSENSWAWTYEEGSVSTPAVTSATEDFGSVVYAANYRYTNGMTDTIYVGVTKNANGDYVRTCLAYAIENEFCDVYGKHKR